jgi:transposase InsO family protein
VVTPAARREAITILVETYEMSERRACKVIGADRSSVRYASRRPDDTALRERMKEVAHDRRRFGYRRVHVLLLIGAWVTDYNTRRPHSALGYQTPAAFAATCQPHRASKPVAPTARMSNINAPVLDQTG